jgi:hypothetical protein
MEMLKVKIESIANEATEKEQDLTFEILNETPELYLSITDFQMNMPRQIIISGTSCWEVTCECAKNTSTPCMDYCFKCKEEVWENLK